MTRRRFVCALWLGWLCLAPVPALAEFTEADRAELRERFRSAEGPEERRALRREFRQRFRRATPEERSQMQEFVREMRIEAQVDDPSRGERPRSLSEVVEVYRDATPEQQQEIRRRLEERLSELPPARRRRAMQTLRREFRKSAQEDLRALGADLGGLSDAEKRRVRQRVRELPPGDRRALMDRLGRYRALPPEEQQALRDRLSEYRALPEEEQERLRRNAARFREMPEGDRERLRDAMRQLRQLPPDERKALMEELLAE